MLSGKSNTGMGLVLIIIALLFLRLSFNDIYFFYIGLIFVFFSCLSINAVKTSKCLDFSSVFYAMGILYAIGPFLSALILETPRYQVDNHIILVLYVVLALISFRIGYASTKTKRRPIETNVVVNHNIVVLILSIFFLVYLFSVINLIKSIGLYAFVTQGRGEMKMAIGESFKAINILDPLIYVVEVLALEFFIITKGIKNYRIKYGILFFSSLFVSIAFSLIQVDRSSLLLSLLPMVFLLNYHGLLSLRRILFYGTALLALFVVWKQLIAGLIMGDIGVARELDVTVPTEIVAWFDVGCDVQDGLESGKIDYKYGYTYLKALESFVNPFWQNYEALSTWYVRTFRPDMFEHGGGKGFSCVLEAVLNFGFIGPILCFGFIGSFVKRIERKVPSSIFYRCFYALMISLVYKLFRSEIYSIVKMSYWLWVLPIFFIWYLSREKTALKSSLNK